MEQNPSSYHLVNVIANIACIISIAYKGNLQWIHFMLICICSHKVGFSDCYPKLNARRDSLGKTIYDFVHDFGFPENLTFAGFQSQVGQNTKFNKNLRKYRINHHISAPRRPNENPDEGAIR